MEALISVSRRFLDQLVGDFPNEDAYAWHVHHDILFERIPGGIEGFRVRVQYLIAHKPQREIQVRLYRLAFVRALVAIEAMTLLSHHVHPAKRRQLYKTILQYHDVECPNCPWTDEQGLFFD